MATAARKVPQKFFSFSTFWQMLCSIDAALPAIGLLHSCGITINTKRNPVISRTKRMSFWKSFTNECRGGKSIG